MGVSRVRELVVSLVIRFCTEFISTNYPSPNFFHLSWSSSMPLHLSFTQADNDFQSLNSPPVFNWKLIWGLWFLLPESWLQEFLVHSGGWSPRNTKSHIPFSEISRLKPQTKEYILGVSHDLGYHRNRSLLCFRSWAGKALVYVVLCSEPRQQSSLQKGYSQFIYSDNSHLLAETKWLKVCDHNCRQVEKCWIYWRPAIWLYSDYFALLFAKIMR